MEVLSDKGCVPVVIDMNKWDTWAHGTLEFNDILARFTDAEIKILENGPLRAGIRVINRYNRSTLTQDFILYRDKSEIDVKVKLDWQERIKMLKLSFPVNVIKAEATWEIPFCRTVLNNGDNIISVSDEITNTKCYLEIQLALHKNGFDVEYGLDEEIYKYDMINIILQPIVENAIEHGIDRKREGRGKLAVNGYLKDECRVFDILDNGPGMEKELIDSIFSLEKGGYGLKNVQQRLKVFFGEEYGISISNGPVEGICVTVKIPQYGHKSSSMQV